MAAASILCPVSYLILTFNVIIITLQQRESLGWSGWSCWCQLILTVVLCCRLSRTGCRPGPHTTTISQCLNLPRVTRAGAHRRGERRKDSGGCDRQYCRVERQTTEETAPLSVPQVSLSLVVVCNVSIVYCIEAVSKMSRHFSHQA